MHAISYLSQFPILGTFGAETKCLKGQICRRQKKKTLRSSTCDLQRIKQVVHQATKMNEAISAARGVPLPRAHITYGGYYDGIGIWREIWPLRFGFGLHRKRFMNRGSWGSTISSMYFANADSPSHQIDHVGSSLSVGVCALKDPYFYLYFGWWVPYLLLYICV